MSTSWSSIKEDFFTPAVKRSLLVASLSPSAEVVPVAPETGAVVAGFVRGAAVVEVVDVSDGDAVGSSLLISPVFREER